MTTTKDDVRSKSYDLSCRVFPLAEFAFVFRNQRSGRRARYRTRNLSSNRVGTMTNYYDDERRLRK